MYEKPILKEKFYTILVNSLADSNLESWEFRDHCLPPGAQTTRPSRSYVFNLAKKIVCLLTLLLLYKMCMANEDGKCTAIFRTQF